MTSYINYVLLLTPTGVFQPLLDFVYRIRLTFILLFIKKIVMKLMKLNPIKRFKQYKYRKSEQFRNKLTEKEKNELFEEKTFDFIGGIQDMVAIYFMMVGFVLLDFITILPIGIIGLYVSTIVDKYVIINYSKPVSIRSIDYAMNFPKHMTWDAGVFLSVFLAIMIKYVLTGDEIGFSEGSQTAVFVLMWVMFGLVIILLMAARITPKKFMRKKFDAENAHFEYDDKKELFTSLYEIEYPVA